MILETGYDFSKLTALVIDDSAFIRRAMEEILRSLNFFSVETAEHGQGATQLLKQYEPDIIFVDWEMAPGDGPAFIQELRGDEASPNRFAAIILLTAFAERDHVLQAREFGVTGVMVKPISPESIYRRIAYMIDNPRPYIDSGSGFFGPCRRRLDNQKFSGEERRKETPTEIHSGEIDGGR